MKPKKACSWGPGPERRGGSGGGGGGLPRGFPVAPGAGGRRGEPRGHEVRAGASNLAPRSSSSSSRDASSRSWSVFRAEATKSRLHRFAPTAQRGEGAGGNALSSSCCGSSAIHGLCVGRMDIANLPFLSIFLPPLHPPLSQRHVARGEPRRHRRRRTSLGAGPGWRGGGGGGASASARLPRIPPPFRICFSNFFPPRARVGKILAGGRANFEKFSPLFRREAAFA